MEKWVFNVVTSVVSKVIPYLVSVDDNAGLLAIPSISEVKDAFFFLNNSSALGLDGFSGVFFAFVGIALVLKLLM